MDSRFRGGGTLSLTVAGTTRIYGDETQAAASDTGDIFIDVSTSLLGAATVTGDYFVIDDIGSFGCMPWLKFTAVVANSDASTVLNVEYYNKEVQ